MLLQEGRSIRDTYEVERFLGEGAFAEVYRVRHRFLGRQAMKVLKARGTTLDELQQMLDEAVLLSRIGHPNIIRVYDANVLEVADGTAGYFTMEYIAGGSLDRYWRSFSDRKMPVEEVVEIIRQTSAGVAVAHAEDPPIVHRDIKPQNILVGYDGGGLRIRIGDFGLAKRVNPLTMLLSAKGTLSFKPPESFENMDSPAADVWAIGTTLYLLLTDELPFPELDERELQDGSRFLRPLRPPSIYNIGVNAALDAIVARCLERDPSRRYPNAVDLLEDLRNWRPGDDSPANLSQGSTAVSTAKSDFGSRSPANALTASQMLEEALKLAANPRNLVSAADLLEEAISRAPELRDKYESKLRLWRRGICM